MSEDYKHNVYILPVVHDVYTTLTNNTYLRHERGRAREQHRQQGADHSGLTSTHDHLQGYK